MPHVVEVLRLTDLWRCIVKENMHLQYDKFRYMVSDFLFFFSPQTALSDLKNRAMDWCALDFSWKGSAGRGVFVCFRTDRFLTCVWLGRDGRMSGENIHSHFFCSEKRGNGFHVRLHPLGLKPSGTSLTRLLWAQRVWEGVALLCIDLLNIPPTPQYTGTNKKWKFSRQGEIIHLALISLVQQV